jgi:hypothetical protein
VRKTARFVCVVAIIVAALGIVVPARAEDEPLPNRFKLRVGGFNVINADTIVRLDAKDLPVGTYIDFSDTLHGDTSSTVLRIDTLYRFNDRHALAFEWYALKLTGSTELGKDIEWNGQTYPINTHVDSQLKFALYNLDYRYSLFNNEKVELGGSFGLHIMTVSASIAAQDINQAAAKAVTAPLPVFGLYARYNFVPRFSVFYEYQFFFINFEDKVKGALQSFEFGLEYRIIRNFSLGISFNRFAMNLELNSDTARFFLDSNWNGGMLFGALYF